MAGFRPLTANATLTFSIPSGATRIDANTGNVESVFTDLVVTASLKSENVTDNKYAIDPGVSGATFKGEVLRGHLVSPLRIPPELSQGYIDQVKAVVNGRSGIATVRFTTPNPENVKLIPGAYAVIGDKIYVTFTAGN